MKIKKNNSTFLYLILVILFTPELLFGKQHEFFPRLRKPNNGIFVIAHRGAHVGIPENSLPAYQKAIELGCDFVEIDIRTTKDGHFVSIHNAFVDNYVTGKTGEVKKMTLAELKELDIGEKFGDKWKNTRIPTFEEILELCKGKIGIYLDLKDAPVPDLMSVLRKYDMETDVVWYIPYHSFMEIKNVNQTFGNSFPMPDPQKEANLDVLFAKGGFKVIATDMGVLTSSFVKKAHENGVMLFVDEKVGNSKEWQKMMQWGTDGIQTDNPEELISFLKSGRK